MRSRRKPATQILARRTVRPIAKGESLTLSSDLFADLVPGTGSVRSRSVRSTALDAAALLAALDRYPFGCSEQITSRALPLLYVNDLASDGASCARHRDRPAHPRRDRPAAGAAGLERLVRPVGGGRRRRVARLLRHRLPDAGARAQLRGAGRRVQARARPAAQLRRATRRSRPRTAGAISPMRSMCWRATASRRSAICAISPTPSSTTLDDPDRQGADRRGARHARRPRARRARLCGGARRHRAAAGARLRPHRLRLGRCAMRRRWWRSPRKAARRARRSSRRSQRVEAARDADALHLDAGECVDGARRPRARARTPPAMCCSTSAGDERRAARSTAASAPSDCPAAPRDASPTPARAPCRRW